MLALVVCMAIGTVLAYAGSMISGRMRPEDVAQANELLRLPGEVELSASNGSG
jgi:hypothetical protein